MYNKILTFIEIIEQESSMLNYELKQCSIFLCEKDNYSKQDKENLKIIWERYITLFNTIKDILKQTKYKSFFLKMNYSKFILNKHLLTIYIQTIIWLAKQFWNHEHFIRKFLEENFKEDYWYFAKFIYKPRLIRTINTPNLLIKAFKIFIDKDVYKLLQSNKQDLKYFSRVHNDYKNLYFYIRNRFDIILRYISKFIWIIVSKIKFSPRKNWLLSPIYIDKYLKIANPWDIFLTRGNWNASNISIPWFWKHMSIYVWTWTYLDNNYPDISFLDIKKDSHYLIESTNKGVLLKEVYDLWLNSDYLWVFRVNFSQDKINRSIFNSLSYLWKWYDFLFDFYSDKSLICSELVLKAFSKDNSKDEGIEIELESIWRWITYPPNNFINTVINNNDKIKPIFFIDCIEKTHDIFLNSNEELIKSGKRPRLSFFQK